MTEKQSEVAVPCPWCEKNETLVDTVNNRVSCQCAFCEHYYKIDFKTMRATKIRPKTYRKK